MPISLSVSYYTMDRKERNIVEMIVYLFSPLIQYLWLCFKSGCRLLLTGAKKVAKGLGWLVLVLIGGFVFNSIVQPVLVHFHPMFSDNPPGFEPGHETPATLAAYVTVFITTWAFFALRSGIKKSYNTGIQAGIKEFVRRFIFLLFLPLLPILTIFKKLIMTILPITGENR